MKIIKEHNNQVICNCCKAVLEWEDTDLRWTHTEPDYYYVKCPCCESSIWLKTNKRLEAIYNSLHNK